jgi:hypothetical protein
MWNTQGTSESKTTLTCSGNSYDITGLEGLGLVEKLKAVARENGFSKFDVIDGANKTLSPSDIETGDFSGNLSLVRYNIAA